MSLKGKEPAAMFVMNQEEGTLTPILSAIWEDGELYDLIEEYLNKRACTIACLPYESDRLKAHIVAR
jgi:hypothetical protein